MDPEQLSRECGDDGSNTYLDFSVPRIEKIREEIRVEGYSIVKSLVPVAHVNTIKTFWLAHFSGKPQGRVTWAPYMGQKNHVGLSKDTFQSLYRACDFLWNTPIHLETRAVAMRLHAVRNIVAGVSPRRGVEFSPDRYGVFIATSFYPAGTGYMKPHDDGVAPGEMLIHCLAPVTFRGTDYAEGGMTIVDRKGVTHDVEALLSPGDVVFYDGALVHGVSPILGTKPEHTGRVQISPLPTILKDFRSNPRALNTIPFTEFFAAKMKGVKNSIQIKLGMWPGFR